MLGELKDARMSVYTLSQKESEGEHVVRSHIYAPFQVDNIFKGSCANIKSCVGGKNGLKA